MELNRIYCGDCLEVLATFPDASVDAIVTDPPYGLAFMGKRWDYDVPSEDIWRQCFRVLKDGGRLLAFSGARTMHRMVCRIEDAGFTIEDTVAWLYGSGFPKHRSKLKPAWEPITVARKGKVSLLNIDAARIGDLGPRAGHGGGHSDIFPERGNLPEYEGGRWPANVCMDEPAADLLDQQSGTLTSGLMKANQPRVASIGKGGYHDNFPDTATLRDTPADSGGASRFFLVAEPDALEGDRFLFCAKASRSEREKGLDEFEARSAGAYGEFAGDGRGRQTEHTPARNHHPTVKPIDLMRWLCRLVVPKGSIILDPFCGSGTTCIAADAELMHYIGIEMDEQYCEIARARIAHHHQDTIQTDLFEV